MRAHNTSSSNHHVVDRNQPHQTVSKSLKMAVHQHNSSCCQEQFNWRLVVVLAMVLMLAMSTHFLTMYTTANRLQMTVRNQQHLSASSRPYGSLCTTAGCNAEERVSVRLFLGVLSAAANTHARDVVRKTWGSDPRLAKIMFFVLRPKNDTVFTLLRQEAVTLGDIFVTSEVYEDYYNITYSVLDIFKAAALLGDAITHVAKTDDDCYVRLDLLLPALQSMPRQWLYAGAPMKPESVRRSPGWHYVPYSNWVRDDPVRYGFGMGYVVSLDIAREIAAGAAHMVMQPNNLLVIEDVAVAYWVQYIARDRNVTIAYNSSIVHSQSCSPAAMFEHVLIKPQWKTIQCMYDHGGGCCPPQLTPQVPGAEASLQ